MESAGAVPEGTPSKVYVTPLQGMEVTRDNSSPVAQFLNFIDDIGVASMDVYGSVGSFGVDWEQYSYELERTLEKIKNRFIGLFEIIIVQTDIGKEVIYVGKPIRGEGVKVTKKDDTSTV